LTGPFDAIRGLTFQLYGGPSQNLPGPVTLYIDNVLFTEVPEPSAAALLACGAVVGMWRWCRQRKIE
jgi:hypothetical protein